MTAGGGSDIAERERFKPCGPIRQPWTGPLRLLEMSAGAECPIFVGVRMKRIALSKNGCRARRPLLKIRADTTILMRPIYSIADR